MNEFFEYEDIIDVEYHKSANHHPMSLHDRAAQFSPFAALTGHEAVIEETGRLTSAKKELDDNEKEKLDNKLAAVYEKIEEKPLIKVTYFVSDEKKAGGEYRSICGKVKKIDYNKRVIIIDDGKMIFVDDIIDINIL